MEWKLDADRPIYSQLVDGIVRRILAGLYPLGSKLPAVRDLAVQAGVNPNTMQRALAQLENMGLLYTQRTSGRFVTEDGTKLEQMRQTFATQTLDTCLDAMEEIGYSPQDTVQRMQEQIEKRRQHHA